MRITEIARPGTIREAIAATRRGMQYQTRLEQRESESRVRTLESLLLRVAPAQGTA